LNNKNTLKIIINWIGAWLFIAGGSIYVLPLIGADQLHKFYITACYFLTFALLGINFFQINLKSQLIFYILSALTMAVICLFIERVLPIGTMATHKIMVSKFYFPLFHYETLITKAFDVFFQQVFIWGLLQKLKKNINSHKKIIYLFSFCFFIVHIPLLISFNVFYALCFIIPSVVAGIMFSYLILSYQFGPSLSQALHLSFYLALGIYLRI
jgi:hypothetical protein